MNTKTVTEKAFWEPRPGCAQLLLLEPENNRNIIGAVNQIRRL